MKALPIVLLALAACQAPSYTPPEGETPLLSWTSPKGFDETWEAIVGHFAENTIDIETLEKESGIIVAKLSRVGVYLSLEYVDFGTLGADPAILRLVRPYDWFASDILMRHNVFARERNGETLVNVHTSWSASLVRPRGELYPETKYGLTGVSTGVFERALLEDVATRLGVSDPVIDGPPVPDVDALRSRMEELLKPRKKKK